MTDRTTLPDTQPDELDALLAAADAAAVLWAECGIADRAEALRTIAYALDTAESELVKLAQGESHLPEPRLRSELARTTFQLRHFAEVVEEGSWLEAVIDTADPNARPPRPDLRRLLVPLGPVVVFAASNFPFAFSVAGGDTVAALAAGCPVVVKSHPGHPRLALRTGEIVQAAVRDAGAPDGVFELIFGLDAGREVLTDPRVKAGSFTGSYPAGSALFHLAASRPKPIPFYAEMSSLNPVFVTSAAATARGADIARGYVGSFTLGTGQFCTKPGLLFLPAGHGIGEFLGEALREVPAAPMLGDWISEGYQRVLAGLKSIPGVQTVVDGKSTSSGGVTPTLLRTTVPDLIAHADVLLEECFGPTSIIVEYATIDELYAAADVFGGNLAATVHAEVHDTDLVEPLLTRLRERVGRLIWNGWPTGVAVAWAMHHGGPYPATTSPLFTSVGATGMRRFLRPVCYQDMPQGLLPEALRDSNVLGIPRRVNGVLTEADVTAQRQGDS
ncbi:MAG: aldehyde dehydrogenase (NADP(+)) [Haloechinothrix sp.]